MPKCDLVVYTSRLYQFLREVRKLLRQRGYGDISCDAFLEELTSVYFDGEVITFCGLSDIQFFRLEDTAVCLDLRYEGCRSEVRS